MSNIFNFRPLFFSFVAFSVGIAFSYYIFSLQYLYIGIILSAFIALLVFSIVRKKIKKFLLIFLVFLVGLAFFFVGYNSFSTENYNGAKCEISGYVSDDSYETDSMIYVTLNNVYINQKKSKNITLEVYKTYNAFTLNTGEHISCYGEVYNEKLFENGKFNSYVYKCNTPYYAYVSSNDLNITEGKLSFAESVRQYVKSLLLKLMPEDSAELSYSILFGDKSSLDKQVKDNFSSSGIAHLLAVSGLHISFLVSILYFLLNKMKTKPLVRFIIVSVFLIFYSYLCSFSPSVVRASLMCVVFMLVSMIGKQNDLLNSIAISGLIILLIKPLYIFDAGFIMSFGSVLAIAILAKSFRLFFNKNCKIPSKIADVMAIDISTTIAILPVISVTFGKISFLSFLANLVAIPVFSIAYSLLFVFTILVSLMGFLGFLLSIPSFLLNVVMFIAGGIASVKFAIIPLFTLSAVSYISFYVILFILSRMCMAKHKNKVVASLMVVLVGSGLSLAFCGTVSPKENTYTQLNTRSPSVVLTSKNGEVLVVCEKDFESVEDYLQYKRYNKVNVLLSTNNISSIVKDNFINKYGIENVVSMCPTIKNFGSFIVKYISLNGNFKGVYVELEQFGVFIGFNGIGKNQLEQINQLLKNYNLMAVYENSSGKHFDLLNGYDYLFSNYAINLHNNNFSTSVMGSFTFSINNGIISEIRSAN